MNLAKLDSAVHRTLLAGVCFSYFLFQHCRSRSPLEDESVDGKKAVSDFTASVEKLIAEKDETLKRTRATFAEHQGKLCEMLVDKLNEIAIEETKAGNVEDAAEIKQAIPAFEGDDRSSAAAMSKQPRRFKAASASSVLKLFRKAQRELVKNRNAKIESDQKLFVDEYERLKEDAVSELNEILSAETSAGNLNEASEVKKAIQALRKLKPNETPASQQAKKVKAAADNPLSVRTGVERQAALKSYGGTDDSESAVKLGLEWIVKHQLRDGSWSFDHRVGPGRFRDSPNPGELTEAHFAATAMALLPLLGDGQTHLEGKYKDSVQAGLNYLMKNAQRNGNEISYFEKGGTMYSHALCSSVFCEAYAMTGDRKLAPFARGTISYMETTQDPAGGGWRYAPKQRGDTSVTGWHVMAFKTAELSNLKVDARTWERVDKFLNNVSNDEGFVLRILRCPKNKN